MDFQKVKEKGKSFLAKLQQLNDGQKKAILWSVVGVLAVVMGYFWFKDTLDKFENMDLNLGNFQTVENYAPETEENLEFADNSATNSETFWQETVESAEPGAGGESEEDLRGQIKSLEERLNNLEQNNQK